MNVNSERPQGSPSVLDGALQAETVAKDTDDADPLVLEEVSIKEKLITVKPEAPPETAEHCDQNNAKDENADSNCKGLDNVNQIVPEPDITEEKETEKSSPIPDTIKEIAVTSDKNEVLPSLMDTTETPPATEEEPPIEKTTIENIPLKTDTTETIPSPTEFTSNTQENKPTIELLDNKQECKDEIEIPEQEIHPIAPTPISKEVEVIPPTEKLSEQVEVPVSPPQIVKQELEKLVEKESILVQEAAPVKVHSPPVTVPIKKEENTPVKEVLADKHMTKVVDTDVEMIEVPPVAKVEEKPVVKPAVTEPEVQVNGDVTKDDATTKRRSSEELETESPLKKLCREVEKTFPQHDSMINNYIDTATKNNIDEIQRHTEQLLAEIQTLRELAQKKEHEWNNILHLKKVKEEILLRLLRRKQVSSFEKSVEINGSERKDPFEYMNQVKNLAIDKSDEISGLALKQPTPPINPSIMQPPMMPVTTHFNPLSGLPPPYDKVAHMQAMTKPPVFPQTLMMPGPGMSGFPREMNGQLNPNFSMPMGRQGPTKDVKSIIADYRQRNPDVSPRRGRRMNSLLNPKMMNQGPRQIAPKMDNLSNLGMIFNNLDMNQKAMLERLSQMQTSSLPNGMSFKDVLVQFANMQHQGMMPNRPEMMPQPRPEQHHKPDRRRPERQERPERPPQHHEEVQISVKQQDRVASSSPRLPPPPPYPEISLLPVNQEGGQASQQNSLLHGILTKNCGEITITPVAPSPAAAAPADARDKADDVVQLDDEESPASEGSAEDSREAAAARLAVDEAGGGAGAAGGAAAGGEAPLCQGCRRRDAQFVCAGCANQWYCSRDCQVAAWDDHSEMCSG